MENISCYNCKSRHLGCHSNCEKYSKYKATLQKIKMRKKEDYDFYYSQKRKR